MVQTFHFSKKKIFKKTENKNFKNRKKKIAKKNFEERKCVKCKYCVDLPEIGVFMLCMVAYDIAGFVLRAFLAPWNAFYDISFISYHMAKENGLERLKMRFLNF